MNFVYSTSYEKKWKCVNFKCYSSEELITLNTLHEVVPTWYSFLSWVDWSNADKVSCSRRKHFDAGVWTVNVCIQGRHSNHYTNCSKFMSNYMSKFIVLFSPWYYFWLFQCSRGLPFHRLSDWQAGMAVRIGFATSFYESLCCSVFKINLLKNKMINFHVCADSTFLDYWWQLLCDSDYSTVSNWMH